MRLPLATRAPIYRWLARFFVQEVDREVWQSLGEDPFREILLRLEPTLESDLESDFDTALQAQWAEEFARLFLMPDGTPPYLSAWLEGDRDRIREDLVTLASRSFELIGREPVRAEPWGRLPLDHVALLLDLVANAAMSENSEDRVVADHLDRELMNDGWCVFGDALRKKSQTPLYRALGGLLSQLHSTPPD